ncbi:MAG: hypothetical protein Q4F29_06140 [Lachnospiraceae bacterium]|nr:hypothetical protein [Lachnospiraceae bacterium]
MTGIIDIHAHVLPGMDDGAEHLEEALQMLQMAYGQGVRKVIATPHYQKGEYQYSLQEAKEAFRTLKEAAQEKLPDMSLYLGQEIYYFSDLTEELTDGRALTLAGSRFVLVEFSTEVSWSYLYQAVRKLSQAGYLPIIAHVERYPTLRQAGRLKELKEAGARLQMNFRSLQGSILNQRTRWCRNVVLEGSIHYLATDMHNTDSRRPEIDKTAEWLLKKGGMRLLRKLTEKNQEEILNIYK